MRDRVKVRRHYRRAVLEKVAADITPSTRLYQPGASKNSRDVNSKDASLQTSGGEHPVSM